MLEKYVFPHWGTRDFTSLRRSDIAALLDHLEDHHGARQADYVLAIIRQIANWYSTRNDDFLSPFTRGMRRAAPNKRERVLDDTEIRRVWKAAEQAGTFGGLIRLLLLTAQRRDKVTSMRRADISDDGVWEIPTAPREKGHAGALRLPPIALDIIKAQPRFASTPFVFAGRGKGPINGFSKVKGSFDEAAGVEGWVLHDLRRTARSLMSRVGVSSEHAERVMGHAIPGAEGVYDRHAYFEEKAIALEKLAALVEQIVHGAPGGNVVTLRAPAVQP